MNVHLTPEELAAFVDGDLQRGERVRVEAHLADCDACLDEIAAVEHLARARPGRRASRTYALFAAVSAAAAIVLMLAIRERPVGAPGDLRTPTDLGTVASTLDALEPVGEVASTGGIALRWEAAQEGTLYRIALMDSVGSVIWSAETRDSNISVPLDVRARLQAGARYFWRTDALLPDLGTATTGDQPFRLRP